MCDSAGEFRSYQDGFILDGSKLTRIVEIIAEFGKRVHPGSYLLFRVEKAGRRFYTTKDLSIVLKDDNSVHDGISSLTARLCMPETSGTDEPQTIATVSFRKGVSTPIEITVEGRNREWCALLISELDQQMTRVRQKRTFRALTLRAADSLAAFSAGGAFLVTFLLTTGWTLRLASGAADMTGGLGARELLSLAVVHSSPLWIWGGVMTCFALLFATNEYRPVSRFAGSVDQSVFHWGDGVEAYRRSRAWQSAVLWSVLVAFVVSLAASAVATWLMPPV